MIVIDTETTGVDRDAEIVELAIDSRVWRFKPSRPIPAEATAVHGITDADVAACETFARGCAEPLAMLHVADTIVGFNLRFDLDMLAAEIDRAKLPPLDITTKRLICVMRLWQHMEPRTLTAAHAKFCGGEHAAHTATGDVAATSRVLDALVALGGDVANADPLPDRHTWFGPSRHLRWDGDVIVFGFGKHEGMRIDQVDPDYIRWMQRQDFPEHVKKICGRASAISAEEFAEWVAKFPRAARAA